MDDQQSVLFSFGVDETAKTYLISTAKWNRFLAIVGIVVCFLVILALVFGGSFFFANLARFGGNSEVPALSGAYLGGIIFIYIIFIGIYLVPCFYMLSFSNKMLRAIANTDQEMFNMSLKHLNIYSRFWGILTIIIISIYLLFFTIAILAGALMH